MQGLAQYDLGLAMYYQGKYEESLSHFRAALATGNPAIPTNRAQLMSQHARACAGYHKVREQAGIFEPGKVDPLCGVESLQKIARHYGIVLSNTKAAGLVKHTGEGSSMQQIADGIESVGLHAYPITCDEAGLRLVSKPLVAHVEHDHFITVTSADDSGVSFWCVDCGGDMHVTWPQWKLMEADAYLVCTRPGSLADKRQQEMALSTLRDDLYASLSTVGIVAKPKSVATRHITPLPAIPAAVCGEHPPGLNCSCDQSCPRYGGHINLATAGEEYEPAPDLTVYNPKGPSLSWARYYGSLGYPIATGFGGSWSHSYNYGIMKPGPPYWTTEEEQDNDGPGSDGFAPSTPPAYLILPNSSRVELNKAPSAHVGPTHPVIPLSVEHGHPYLAEWDWDFAGSYDYFKITLPNHSVIKFMFRDPAWSYFYPPLGTATGSMYRPDRVTDAFGNYITFDYATRTRTDGSISWPECGLSDIKDSSGTALLTCNYDSDAHIVSVEDCYNRSVYYETEYYANAGVPSPYRQGSQELTAASQIVATGTGSPPARYVYGYSNYGNGEVGETVPFLHTIGVVNPTGTGVATTTLDYDSSSGFVQKETDPNGNTINLTASGILPETTVQVKNAAGTVALEFTSQFDAQMNWCGQLDAASHQVWSALFASPNNPLKASSVTDGNSRTWNYTWDQYGNLLTSQTPKSVTTTNTVDYSSFALGQLTESQTGTKTSTQYTYYSGNGRLHEVLSPIPGEASTGFRQTTTYTYDSMGNLTQVASPGNNSEATHTTSLGYTTDGAYSQAEALGQPITITDPNGKVTHLRYDSRNNSTSVTDANGNETDYAYNIANQPTVTTFPATGNTGVGQAQQVTSYLYPAGPVVQEDAKDESGSVVRTVAFTYGPAGETLSRTGSAEEVALTYTPFYSVATLQDGNTNATTYTYNTKGQVTQITYPGATGTYFDKVQFTSYDDVGNLLTRVDGNGQTTNYTYGDTDGLLSQISYPSSSYGNLTFSYDSYDRLDSGTDWTGTFGRSYDDLGNVVQSTRNYGGISPSTTYTFDYGYYPEGSRMTMANIAGTWTYYRDKDGRCTSMSSPAGTHGISYYDNGWESGRTLPNGTTTAYTYNGVGALTGLVNATSGSVTRSSFGSFGYDGVFNLSGISASVPPDTNQNRTLSFTYDTKDRLTADSSLATGSGYGYSNTFGYDAAGNPTTFRGSTQTFNADNQNAAYTEDGNGNTTAAGTASMTFDPENHLKTRTVGSLGREYTYRADGLRASRKSTGPILSSPTFFLYDGGEPVLELSSTGTVTAKNVFAPDGLVARYSGSAWTYYTFDHQGNVVNRENASEGVINSSAFDGYGKELCDGTPDCWGYNARWGYYHDLGTGFDLYLCQHRYYDANAGRWLTRDPIGYRGGIGLYGYCGSRPLKHWDRSGYQEAPPDPIPPIGGDGDDDEGGYGGASDPYEGTGPGGIVRGILDEFKPAPEEVPEWMPGADPDPPVEPIGPGGTLNGQPLPLPEPQGAGLNLNDPDLGPKGFCSNWEPNSAPPNDPNPDPSAEGRPHSVLGWNTSRRSGRYRQGWEYDEDVFQGRTDATDHGRPQNHTNPHRHGWPGPMGPWGPGVPIP